MRKIIETLGNMTYSSYLLHIPVQLLLAIVCFHWKILLPVYNPAFLMGYFCLIFFLSYFTYRYFELPMKKGIKAAKPQNFILTVGILIYLCLSFTPAVSFVNQRYRAGESHKSSKNINYSKSAQAFVDVGNHSQAIAAYKHAIAIYPNAEDYGNLGMVYFELGDYTQALTSLNRALVLNPNYFRVYNGRSAVYSAQGRDDLSFQDLNTAIAMDPCPESVYKKENLDDPKKAICQSLSKIYFNLGSIYGVQGDYTKAITHLNEAIERAPDFALAYEGRAACYFQLKDYVRARQDAQKAKTFGVDVDPVFLK